VGITGRHLLFFSEKWRVIGIRVKVLASLVGTISGE